MGLLETSKPASIKININIIQSAIDYYLIPMHTRHRGLFPGYNVAFTIVADGEEIQTHVTGAPKGTPMGDPYAGNRIECNLDSWYKKHTELRPGDKVSITMVEPMKKYRLEIVK